MERLERLGLNRNEAKIYLALLDLGEAQAGQISKKTQINRTTTYDSVERLIQRGLATYVIKANKKVFQPVPPQKLLEKIKEEEKIAEDILPELEARFKQTKEKEESNIYKGRQGIKSILNDLLNLKEYVAFGSSGKFLELMKHDFVQFQKQKEEKKIKARVILSKSSKTSESVKLAYTTFRFIPDEFSFALYFLAIIGAVFANFDDFFVQSFLSFCGISINKPETYGLELVKSELGLKIIEMYQKHIYNIHFALELL